MNRNSCISFQIQTWRHFNLKKNFLFDFDILRMGKNPSNFNKVYFVHLTVLDRARNNIFLRENL